MKKIFKRLALTSLLTFFLFFNNMAFSEPARGIYLTQSTVENTQLLNYLIANAKRVGINTFIADLEIPGKRYEKNIALLKQNGIRYVVRIEMFPGGGTAQQITNEEYWKRKYKLMQTAIKYGAEEVQMDYIRYNTRSGSSPEHAKNVYKIVRWYKDQLTSQNIPLQIDVFGISSYGEEPHIGQNIPMISQTVDTLCPMVYPSHYQPFREHAATPYETVYTSLTNIQKMFKDQKMPIKLIPYIELSNYHYLLSHEKKKAYVRAQLKAVKDANANGWYAWSAHNFYDVLFEVLADPQNTDTTSFKKDFPEVPAKTAKVVDAKPATAPTNEKADNKPAEPKAVSDEAPVKTKASTRGFLDHRAKVASTADSQAIVEKPRATKGLFGG